MHNRALCYTLLPQSPGHNARELS